ncbi:hypothetical protein B0H34DRAFT_716392 [Crassisporium funariophilum]|nr:hypothetical protein B0H34DRAFT_716392 [Crassisporium funariophilum]
MSDEEDLVSLVSLPSISSPETQFIPQEDDEETLWEVIEITAEKPRLYKVRWKGNDPATSKPWPQSWVPRRDCTDDLVRDWKARQENKKARASVGKRVSTAGSKKRASTTVSIASSSKTASASKRPPLDIRRSTSTTVTAADAGPSRGGRSRAAAALDRPDTPASSRLSSITEATTSKLAAKTTTTGTKRKHVELTTTSTDSSANPRGAIVDVLDVPNTKDDATAHHGLGRPRKKRKVTVEVNMEDVKQESHTPHKDVLQPSQEDEEEDQLEEEDDDEEEEERMVEDALSEVAKSPPRLEGARTEFNDSDLEEIPPLHHLPTLNRKIKKPPTAKSNIQNKSSRGSSLTTAKGKSTTVGSSKLTAAPQSTKTKTSKTSANTTVSKKPSTALKTSSKPHGSLVESQVEFRPPAKKKASIPSIATDDTQLPRPNSLQPPVKVKGTKSHALVADKNSKSESRLSENHDRSLDSALRSESSSYYDSEGEDGFQRRRYPRRLSRKGSKSNSESVTTSNKHQIARRSANPPANSYNDVVPETEESQSQSQSQEAKVGSLTTHVQAPELVVPSTPGGRSTLKSRMKPRTPVSRAASNVGLSLFNGFGGAAAPQVPSIPNAIANGSKTIDTNGKLLKPIRHITPSAFRPHLPTSSLPESIVNDSAVPSGNAGDDFEEAPMSSIEEFDSPEKQKERRRGVAQEDNSRGAAAAANRRKSDNDGPSASDVWDSHVVRRGQELAEAARRNEKERLRVEGYEGASSSRGTKVNLFDIVASGAAKGKAKAAAQLAVHDDNEEEILMMSSPPLRVDVMVQEMEDAYVDLSGGVDDLDVHADVNAEADLTMDPDDSVDPNLPVGDTGKNARDPLLEREEEEESTQDLLMDLREHQRGMDDVDTNVGWGGTGGNGTDAPKGDCEAREDEGDGESSGDSADDVPGITVQKPSRAPSTRSYSSLDENQGHLKLKGPTRSRSRSRSRSLSVSSRKSKQKERRPAPDTEIPATAPTRKESVEPSQVILSEKTDVDNPHHLGAAMHLLNAKSEEISKLDSQLSKANSENETLRQQLNSLRQKHHPPPTDGSTDFRQQLDVMRTQMLSQTADWDTEKALLVGQVDSATKSKASAEQDRDFFREQYAKASGFVSSVRDENKELEKRIKIAEEQTQAGVGMVKATFELRIKKLEDDVQAWRKMAEFMMEKDRRTNDDVRRRAGEEPELRARCGRQEATLELAHERIEDLEAQLEEKDRSWLDALEERERWKQDNMRLNLELNEATTKLEKIGKAGGVDGYVSNGPGSVYRCQWRSEIGDVACEAVFLDMSELEEHLFTVGHIRP